MYLIPEHLSGFTGPQARMPIGLPLAPIGGFGATAFPVALSEDPPRSLSTGEKVFLYGLGTLLVVGLGYAFYKKMQVYEHIAKTEGSSGALKLAAGEAAIGVASDWLRPTRPPYSPNFKKGRKKRKKSRA